MWEYVYQNSFETLKALIATDATLQYYGTTSPDILQVDASQKVLGAVLLQPNQRGEERPIAYASKSLTDTETIFANIERQMLVFCFDVERFKTYVYGRSFHIITDHKPPIKILNKNCITPKISADDAHAPRILLHHQVQTWKAYKTHLVISPNPKNKEVIDLDL